jgi:predicted nucleic acid-binding protein
MPASHSDSLVVEFVAPDADQSTTVDALFDQWARSGESLHAPAVLPVQVMNALLTGVRRGRWDGQAADAASGFVATLPISLHDDDVYRHQAWELARRYDNHPIYDMLYVALAQRLGEPLITVDDRLCRRLAPLKLIFRPVDALGFDTPAPPRQGKVTGSELGGYAE